MAALDPKERMQAAIAHRKWIDIAHDLGCTDIRCNMRGGLTDWKQDGDLVKRAVESFRNLVEYSRGSGLNVIVENHGRASSDPGNLAALVKGVEDTRFGLLPDFGNINPGDDNAKVIRGIAPWAKGVSVKAAWDEQGKNPWDIDLMMQICQDAGYHGWWGIESSCGPTAMMKKSDPGVGNQQIWDWDLKGVRLTSERIKRHFHGQIA